MSITRIVRMSFDKEKVDEFLTIFSNSKSKIKNFPGCISLALQRDTKASNVFYTYSVWASEESLESYRQSELFKNTWKSTKQIFDDSPLAYSMQEVEIIE